MWRRAVPDPSRPLLSSHVRGEQGHLMAGVLQAILDSPGKTPVVGVIAPQLKHHQRLNEDRKSIEKQELTGTKKEENKSTGGSGAEG